MTSLFTSQTPSGTNNSDGTPGISFGTTVRFATAGNVTGVRFYATTTVSGTYTGALYQVTGPDDAPSGTLLASKVRPTAPTGGAWNSITFDSPVAVTTGVLYRAVVFSGDGRYVNTSSFFTADLVNGDITADANGEDPIGLGTLGQGVFAINASLAYPSTSFSSSCYFADVEFTASGSTTPFTKDVAEVYRVLNGFTKNTSESYRITNALTKDAVESYRITNAFTNNAAESYRVTNAWQADKVEQYRVLNGWSSDKVDSWRVLNAWAKDLADNWTVLNASGFIKDYGDSWRVYNGFTADVVERHRVLGPWSTDYAEQYRITNSWALDAPDAWRVYQDFTKNVVERYRVLSDTIPPPLPADVTVYLEELVIADMTTGVVIAYID